MFIEKSKGSMFDKDIRLITKKYITLQKEMDEVYCCIRSLSINDEVIFKTISYSKNNTFVERIKITSHTIYSFIGRLHCNSNNFFI